MVALYNAAGLTPSSLTLMEGGAAMRRIITLLTVAAMLAAMLVVGGPASAQGGCKEFGAAIASEGQAKTCAKRSPP
jgi:hypothetical protein